MIQQNLFESMTPKDGDTIVVWFSCGAASAVALKRTIEKYGDRCKIRVVNNPVKEEDDDNRRFLRDVEKWLGVKVEICINPKFPDSSAQTVWEKKRYNRFVLTERDNCLPVLIEDDITKAQCYDIVQKAGVKLPRTYSMGMPNANCYGCVKVQSPGYWALMRKIKPEVFKSRAEFSRKINCRLVKLKGKRIFLDELPEDTEPKFDETLVVDCGIFCEERLDQ